MSPQSRRGRAAQPGHRKSASHQASHAEAHPAPKPVPAGKPAAARKSAAPVEAAEEEQAEIVRPSTPKREGKPVRRKRTLTQVRRSSAARYGGEWMKAYAPLFAVAVIAFAALWAWVSFGPHTPTPKDNWQQIETAWKPKRDADLKKVSTAVAANDLQAEIAAYKSLRDDTTGWMNALTAIKSWENPNATAAPVGVTTPTQALSAFVADGQTIATLLDAVVAGPTQNDMLTDKESLIADEQAFQADFWKARSILTGSTDTGPSPQPTLPMPPGTYVPPASPGPSGSPGESSAPSSAPSATPTATPVPAVSASPS